MHREFLPEFPEAVLGALSVKGLIEKPSSRKTLGQKIAILSSYFQRESYGLLGPQMAATVIQNHTPYECIVIALSHEDDKTLLKKSLAFYFGKERPIVAFSTLSGREDLFTFALELKKEGVMTFLAGPQADSDYLGEVGWMNHSDRFKGFSENFTFSLHGPAEQAISLLKDIGSKEWQKTPGLLYRGQEGRIIRNPRKAWNEAYLGKVRWDNLYRITQEGLQPLKISVGQVLQQIGCPHAARKRGVEIDYPALLEKGKERTIKILSKGCSFCDVAADKGFYGELGMETVLGQICGLPEGPDGRKVPFELINENPLPRLPLLLRSAKERELRLSQLNLILRADWFLKGEKKCREALELARAMDVEILLASVGFEAFDDRLLRNFHKGLDVETNLNAIRLMRRLKDEFPMHWRYSRGDGAIHGFIHPTPWDTREAFANTQKNIAIYGLNTDIIPEHSTPLIVHHASCLGDWIREVEERENIRFKRYGSVIGWWELIEPQ